MKPTQKLKIMSKRNINKKLYEQLKESLTIHHEGGSITEPLYDEVEDVHDAIYNHYKVKDLQHHKDTTIGLFATDKEIGELLYMFWQRTSDACPLECGEAEKQEADFKEWVKTISWKIS